METVDVINRDVEVNWCLRSGHEKQVGGVTEGQDHWGARSVEQYGQADLIAVEGAEGRRVLSVETHVRNAEDARHGAIVCRWPG